MATVYLDAVLEPPRSLSNARPQPRDDDPRRASASSSSLGFLLAGAWPVVGFLGLEILVLWLVFQWSFRTQTARTYVRVTADAVDVRKVDGWGRERRASLAAHFARVEFDRTATGPNALRLATSRDAPIRSANSSPRANARPSPAA